MTVYLAFNEAEGPDTLVSGSLGDTTNTAVSGVATHGFQFDGNGGQATNNFTALTEGWVHCRIYYDGGTGNNSGDVFVLRDTAGTTVAKVRRTANNGVLQASTVNVGNTDITAGDATVDVDFHWNLDATNGFIRVYVDGVLEINDTGDTIATSGITQCDEIVFNDPGRVVGSITVGFGQVVVANRSTVNAKVYTLYPDPPAATADNEWDTGDYTDVDERDVNDADKATTTTDGDKFPVGTSVTLSAPTPPGEFAAVVQTFRASYDSGAAVEQLTPFLDDGVSPAPYFGTTQALTTGLANYSYVWNTDPSDTSEWDETKINSYDFGVRADAP